MPTYSPPPPPPISLYISRRDSHQPKGPRWALAHSDVMCMLGCSVDGRHWAPALRGLQTRTWMPLYLPCTNPQAPSPCLTHDREHPFIPHPTSQISQRGLLILGKSPDRAVPRLQSLLFDSLLPTIISTPPRDHDTRRIRKGPISLRAASTCCSSIVDAKASVPAYASLSASLLFIHRAETSGSRQCHHCVRKARQSARHMFLSDRRNLNLL